MTVRESADWRRSLAVPRELFVPSVVWVDSPQGGFTAISHAREKDRWRALVELDEPIITQVDDGQTKPGERAIRPSSSSSQPSLVAAMLATLDVHNGHRVLEIGTGTGWNAALLCERVGQSGHVVSVEIDPDVASSARKSLANAGYSPSVVIADGIEGYSAEAPFDRIIATASVRSIPSAWLRQTKPGGVIVAPWGSDYCNGACLRLEVNEDGSASGRCGINLAFMRLREQRRDYLDPTKTQLSTAEQSATSRSIQEIVDMITFDRAAFVMGLRLPNCYLTLEEISAEHRLIELHDVGSQSWARVELLRGKETFNVYQLGSRRLWDEVDAAYSWWTSVGRPVPKDVSVTINPDGAHWVRLNTPHGEYSWRLVD